MRQCPTCAKRFLEDRAVCDEDGSPLANVMMTSARDRLVGAVVNNRYRIERVLGDGGMGVVYRARGEQDGRFYAIKVLRNEYSSEEELVTRFQMEAEAVAAVRHPHIVEVYEFGALADGSRYFAMECLEGRSLGQLLNVQGKNPSGRRRPLSEGLTIHIARQICDGLGAAHALGIVHRDMKPDNVHLIRRGEDKHFVKVLDFGIAKVQNSKSARTRTGSVFGTPHYMSPEQAQGERDIDPRTDVYALGVLMYEMATGKVPFDADNLMGILTAHVYHAPAPLRHHEEGRGLSEGFEAVVLKALAKERPQRYASMQALREDLDRVSAGQRPLALDEPAVFARPSQVPATPLGFGDFGPHPEGNDRPTLAGARGAIPAPIDGRTGPGAHGFDGSIPPVTASARGRQRVPVVAGVLALVGFTSFAAAGVIVVRRARAPEAPSHGASMPVLSPAGGAQAAGAGHPLGGGGPVVAQHAHQGAQGAVVAQSTTIRLSSEPAGAQVFRGTTLLGVTPIEIPRPQGGQVAVYGVVAAGRPRVETTVRADTPREVQISLPVLAPARPAGGGAQGAGGPARPQGGRNPQTRDIIDPWNRR